MQKQTLLKHYSTAIIAIIIAMFGAIYFYTVPIIKEEVYEIEKNSARLALNNVHKLTSKMYSNIESFRSQALDAHKQRLKTVVELAEAQISASFETAKKNNIPIEEIRTALFNRLNKFKYGEDGYIWIANSDAVLLSHPDPRFEGKDLSSLPDDNRKHILENVINMAIINGDGYYQYKWNKVNQDKKIDKLSYVKNFPQWGFVVGTGVYLDDIEKEISIRKSKVIQEVRDALEEIQVAKTGYLFIFDESGYLLAHPNKNIDRSNALKLTIPNTNKSIIEELVRKADTDQEFHYKWDRPSDPGNYVYDKISFVKSMQGFGWYICSSVYVDELKYSSQILSKRILIIGLITSALALFLIALLTHHIVTPIKKLSEVAIKVKGGNLSARSFIKRDDELGILASIFDQMVEKIQSNILTLDNTVKSRTEEINTFEERQGLILDSLPVQIAYLDRDLKYLFANKNYAKQFNLCKGSIVGRSLHEVIGDQMMSDINDKVEECLTGKPVSYEYTFEEDGKNMITKRKMLPDINHSNEIVGIVNLSLDITSERESELRLQEAQRMSAAGQLAGGLAHDFNNILSVIQGNLSVASEICTIQEVKNKISCAIRASGRAAEITDRLLSFSKEQQLSPRRSLPGYIIEDTITLLQHSFPSNIKFSSTVNTTKEILIDQGQLENALINLSINAKDAMPEGGRINISASDYSQEYWLEFDEELPHHDFLLLEVSDSGPGFADSVITKAFEPFFTTKQAKKGAGLGLSMVYGFVKQSRGFIGIRNQDNGGACISILLPYYTENASETDSVTSADNTIKPLDSMLYDYLILLIEDDYDVRKTIREQLRSLGANVIEAADGQEGLEILSTISTINFVISDIDLPGNIDGISIYNRVTSLDESLPILLISGKHNDKRNAKFPFLKKPFTTIQLHHKIIQTTDET